MSVGGDEGSPCRVGLRWVGDRPRRDTSFFLLFRLITSTAHCNSLPLLFTITISSTSVICCYCCCCCYQHHCGSYDAQLTHSARNTVFDSEGIHVPLCHSTGFLLALLYTLKPNPNREQLLESSHRYIM